MAIRAVRSGPLFLQWVRRSVTVGVTPVVGDHVDVRIRATVLRVGCADLEHPRRRIRFIDEVMAVGITPSEGRAVTRAQCFFARIGDERQFAIEYPNELVFTAVPMTLTGPGPRFDDCQVDPELGQAGMTREPLTGLSFTSVIKGMGVGAASLCGYDGNVNLLHRAEHLKWRSMLFIGKSCGELERDSLAARSAVDGRGGPIEST
jgi:hypothetical protein